MHSGLHYCTLISFHDDHVITNEFISFNCLFPSVVIFI